VIDDLTIENKRLRQLLRERRQPHNPQVDRDKVFEVRTRGLSSEKRRELGVILQRFASTISQISTATSQVRWSGSSLHSTSCALPEQTPQKGACYLHTDSAYASISNSGLTSVRPSNEGNAEKQQIRGSEDNNIQSYLHDIPDFLLPKHSPIMSEKSKMRLVVKRLEQLFTGKNASPGEHSQPLQQQKVSESAASADRQNSRLLDTYIRPEGSREAHILPCDLKMDTDFLKANSINKQVSGSKSDSEKSSNNGKSSLGNCSPNQRPTRPLDLDINRAQVAEENIKYIRHLGLPTPIQERPPDNADDGWVYLNLLINMAQLHTINVTPAFVRKSISQHSTKFELNKDARKIRWKGACHPTEASYGSDSSAEMFMESSPDLNQEPKPSKQSKNSASLYNLASTGSSSARFGGQLHSLSSERNRLTNSTNPSTEPSKMADKSEPASAFGYKPMFLKHHLAVQDNTFSYDSDHTPSGHSVDNLTGQDLSSHTNPISHHNTGKFEDDDVLIYYRNPWFYCDMSADKQREGNTVTELLSASKPVLGIDVPMDWSDEGQHEHTIALAEHASNQMVIDDNLPSLKLAPLSKIIDNIGHPVDLQASGIGGVLPDDNFMMHVRRKLQRSPTKKALGAADDSKCGLYPIFGNEIVSTVRFELPPSKLPPPSYVFLSLSSESSNGFEDEDSLSENLDDSEGPAPLDFMSHFSTDTSEQRRTADEADNESDSHFSMELWQSANTADPDREAEERSEFDEAAVLDGPIGVYTGSLVATAGAGSGASIASNAAASRDSYSELSTSPESI
jgi:Frequency clock protein